MVTALGNVHEFDCDLLLIFFMFAQNNLAKTALAKLPNYLIVVENGAKIEFLT